MKKTSILLLALLLLLSAAGTSFAHSDHYHVKGNSMYPDLQDGDMVEIVSEQSRDGDMVVAVKKDGTKVVKRLMGDRLVSVSDGTSYSVDEVTILGAARYTPMSLAELEAYGFNWESVLAEGEFIVQIAGGYTHSLALTNAGIVYAWGRNEFGQLGDGTLTQRNTPVKVTGGEMGNIGVDAIAAGQDHSLALKGGQVYAWGHHLGGQLGIGNVSGDFTPYIFSEPMMVVDGDAGFENSDVDAIAAGAFHSLALKGGSVYAWGQNYHGQLGNQNPSDYQTTPIPVAGGDMGNQGVDKIAAGAFQAAALKNGSVYTWGEGLYEPTAIDNGAMGNTGVDAIAAGGYHFLALKDGSVYAWGQNGYGQLGIGTPSDSSVPMKVLEGDMGNDHVTAIAAGAYHSLALKDNKIYAWGSNDFGQLGVENIDSDTNKSIPTLVADGHMGNDRVTAIVAGTRYSLALKDGRVYAWGRNHNGQLGDGTGDNRTEPVKVSRLDSAKPPVITSHPADQTVAKGEPGPSLTVSAVVYGNGTLSYQWFQNSTNSNVGGTRISEATGERFTAPTDQPGTFYYYVEVTNTDLDMLFGQTASAKSNPAQVTVLFDAETPTITSQPKGETAVEYGTSPMLTVSAVVYDGGSLTYQWFENTTNKNTGGTPIPDATHPGYAVPTNRTGTNYYYVEVTNHNENATRNKTATVASEAVAVTILPLVDAAVPVIETQPAGASVVIGAPSPTLTVKAHVSDGGTLSYQWYQNDTNSTTGGTLIEGATSDSYSPTTDQAGRKYYYVEVTNTNNDVTGAKTASITSDAALVTVNPRSVSPRPVSGGMPNRFFVDPAFGRDIHYQGIRLVFPPGVWDDLFAITINPMRNLQEQWQPEAGSLISDIYEITKARHVELMKDFSVTLPFNLNGKEQEQYEIALCRFNEETNEWIPVDGLVVDREANTATGATTETGLFAVIAKEKQPGAPSQTDTNWEDVTGHWAEHAIRMLAQKGWVQGYPDETFRPNEPMTRAEFVSIIIRALGLEASGGITFSDTAGHWAEAFVAAAYEHGIIKGYSDTVFGPDDPITREQLAVILVRAFGLQPKPGEQEPSFTDADQISSWAREAIAIAASHGLFAGYGDGTFKPHNAATRAEIVTVIATAPDISETETAASNH